MKAIAIVSTVAVRSARSDQSVLVSQILYGEMMTVLDFGLEWSKIELDFDGTQGWVSSLQIHRLTEQELQNRNVEVIMERVLFYKQGAEKVLLSIGSEVSRENPHEMFSGDLRKAVVETAELFLNVPYLSGGRSFFGVDASAFIQLVFKVHGIVLPRLASDQVNFGEPLAFIEEAESGDLAFFEDKDGNIVHVAIMLERQQVLHGYGKVRIDDLDSIGIFNRELNKHTHKLRLVKRLL